jgi:acyl-CoA thioesterase-1
MAGCHSDAPSPPDRDAVNTQPAALGSSATQPANPAVADSRPIVACFGDSLTAGYGADDGQSYPDFLQKDLDEAGYHYRVVNEGISGNTTKDGVDRLPEVVELHPAVVVLEFGGNDGLRGLKTQTTRANLAHMIETLKASGARVVLAGMTLPPDYGPDYVNAFTANYPTLAHKYGVPVLPFLLKNVYGVPGLMQADNTHATDQGNAIVAQNLLPLVEPLLKK